MMRQCLLRRLQTTHLHTTSQTFVTKCGFREYAKSTRSSTAKSSSTKKKTTTLKRQEEQEDRPKVEKVQVEQPKVPQEKTAKSNSAFKFTTFRPVNTSTPTPPAWKKGDELFQKSEKILSKLKASTVVPEQEESMEEWVKRVTKDEPKFDDLLTSDEREEFRRMNYDQMSKNWRVYFQRMDRYQALSQMSVQEDELYKRYHADDIQFLHYHDKERYLQMLMELKQIRKKYRDVGKRVKGIFGQRKLALVPITEEERIKDEKFDAKFLNDHANFIPKAYWDRYYEEPDNKNSPEWLAWKQRMLDEHGVDIEKEEAEEANLIEKYEKGVDEDDEDLDLEVDIKDEDTVVKKRAEKRLKKEEFEEQQGIVPPGYYDLKKNPIIQKLLDELPYESEFSEEDLERLLSPEEREMLQQEYLKFSEPADLQAYLEKQSYDPGVLEDEIEDIESIAPVDPQPYRTARLLELEEKEREELRKDLEFKEQYPHFMRGDVYEVPSVLQFRIDQLISTLPKSVLRQKIEMLSTRYRLAMLAGVEDVSDNTATLKSVQDRYIKDLKSSLNQNDLSSKGRYKNTRRNAHVSDIVLTETDCYAYLPAFFPGHFAAMSHVLSELKYRKPEFWPKRWMDFGSGPGVGLWSMLNVFRRKDLLKDENGQKISFREFQRLLQEGFSDQETIEQSEFLDLTAGVVVEPSTDMSNMLSALLRKTSEKDKFAEFSQRNIQNLRFLTSPIGATKDDKLDLIVAGWSLGEIEKKGDRPFFNAVNNILDSLNEGGIALFMEAGSPTGFRTISRIRSYITENMLDTSILMPCGHSMKCPLYDSAVLNQYSKTLDPTIFKQKVNPSINDSNLSWCHFAQRYNRVPVMRYGTRKHAVGTEKYSYIVVQRNGDKFESKDFQVSRVVDDPIKRGEHIQADLCTVDGKITKTMITKGKLERRKYRYARKMRWGDVFYFSKDIKEKKEKKAKKPSAEKQSK